MAGRGAEIVRRVLESLFGFAGNPCIESAHFKSYAMNSKTGETYAIGLQS